MLLHMLFRIEGHSTRMAGTCYEGKLLGHRAVRHFRLRRTGGSERTLPTWQAAAGFIDVAAKGALIRVELFGDDVVVVGFKALAGVHVDLAFVLFHELIPAAMPALIWRIGVVHGNAGFLFGELVVDRKVRTHVIAVL